MPNRNVTSVHAAKHRQVAARIAVETQRRLKRLAIVASPNVDTRENVVVALEDSTTLIIRWSKVDIVTSVEATVDVHRAIKRLNCGLDKSQHIISLMRHVNLRNRSTSNRGHIVATEQTVERGFHVVWTRQRKLVDFEIELALDDIQSKSTISSFNRHLHSPKETKG